MKRMLFAGLLLMVLVNACVKDDDEAEPPKVEILSPFPCDTIYFGENFSFRLKLSDENALGNLSIDIHNNFNHHSHGDNVTCQMDEPKEAINPFSNNWIEVLPPQREHVHEITMNYPVFKEEGVKHDSGDYHFHIYVTNEDGYQVFTTLDIKILHKD